jgi:phosphoribosyl 1,2-cyclic phosphodiesterase
MLWRVAESTDALQIRFWGVRGSVCASGGRFQEFGGHTPCVEVRCGERLFIVDAGTGITALGAALAANAPAEIDILFSHLHLDHIGGLPFFKPALIGTRVIRTHCGNLGGASAEEALGRVYSPPIFPVRLDQLPARFEHLGFRAGERLRFPDGASVDTIPLNHPDGATGYRFAHGGQVVCYISDIEHSDPWPPPDLVRFVAGADLVIYDGMFSEDEYPCCRGWGHSTWHKGVELCRAADVKSLAIFHLHPAHDDARLREMEAELQAAMPAAFIAREGQELSFAAVPTGVA